MLAGLVAEPGDLLHRTRYLLGHSGLLLGRCGDGGKLAAQILHQQRHGIQGLGHRGHGPPSLLHQQGATAHGIGSLPGLLLDAGDGLVDLHGRRAGAARQLPHLVGHHGKSASLLTGPRRLDGRVEGQQVGLLGDGGDYLGDAPHLLALAAELRHRLVRLGYHGGNLRHGRPHAPECLLPLPGLKLRLAGRPGRPRDVARHIPGADRHLLDGRRHRIQPQALARQIIHDGIGGMADFPAGPLHLRDCPLDLPHQLA